MDSILFSHQFESLFHCGLYTYLLSTYFKDDFLKYIDYFIKKDTEYLRFDRDIALISYLLKENKIKAFRIGKIWKIPRLAVEEFILSQSNLKKY